MNHSFLRRHLGIRGPFRALPLLVGWTLVSSVGCTRQLTIEVDRFVNNAPHLADNRPADKCTGYPLHVDIVCVYPADLDNEHNDQLGPDSEITSDIWFENRPQAGDSADDEAGTHFRIPSKQIYVFTDDTKVYGKKLGAAILGSYYKRNGKYTASFEFGGDLHSRRSTIFVFPKFIRPSGGVLPVKPAVFHPQGAYTEELKVRIGVDHDRGDNYGQYIDVKSQRKMHGRNGDS